MWNPLDLILFTHNNFWFPLWWMGEANDNFICLTAYK